MKKTIIIITVLVLAYFGLWYLSIEQSQNIPVDKLDQAQEPDKTDNLDNQADKVLDLSGQELVKLPDHILEMEELTELDLSDNNLTGALPAEIRFLKNLEKLDVSSNQMTGIPAEIGKLTKLKDLNYANNQITGLPLEIGNLENLEAFNLSGNNYAEIDLEKIMGNLPNLKVITD